MRAKKQIKFGISLLTMLLVLGLFLSPQANAAPRTVHLKGFDSLKFSKETIHAKPGEELHVTLTNVSNLPKSAFMSHDWVLLKQDIDVQKFINASAEAKKNGYIAPKYSDWIIAHTGMADKGETVEVTFQVPKTPGKYLYVCTFPGHYAGGMKGHLVVGQPGQNSQLSAHSTQQSG